MHQVMRCSQHVHSMWLCCVGGVVSLVRTWKIGPAQRMLVGINSFCLFVVARGLIDLPCLALQALEGGAGGEVTGPIHVLCVRASV